MIHPGLLLAILVLSPASVLAAGILDCAVLKASIESRLKASHVTQYSLEIVAADQAADLKAGRIVGSCDNGRRKIVYARLPSRPAAGSPPEPTVPIAALKAPVDSRGFIDVWALRSEVIALSEAPTGQAECSQEGDGDEGEPAAVKTRKERLAYERQRRQQEALARKAAERCEQDKLRQSERFRQLQAAFNARWLPALDSAIRAGDPVAEVVLRLCETTALLDRRAIAADCSEKAEDKVFARQRLESIGFKPALHNYTPTADADDGRQRQAACGNGNRDSPAFTECNYRADAARYERILSVMRTGFLAVAESWNSCNIQGPTPELDRLVQECQRLMNLMMAVAAGTDRFYAAGGIVDGVEGLGELSLQRPILRGQPGKPRREWPYDSRGTVTRNDWRPFADPDFQQKFYAELDRTVQEIEARIDEDLREEPRWAVFLVERLMGNLYDAMDTANPSRPTPADIASYDAKTPRSQALRKQQEIERLRTVSYQALIESLRTSNNPKLHYVWREFPLNLQELDRRPAEVAALVNAYAAERNDEVFRFNIIMILNRKKRTQHFSPEEMQLIIQCYVDALNDPSSLVRAEASWQPMLGDQIDNPAIKRLIEKGRQEEQDALRNER